MRFLLTLNLLFFTAAKNSTIQNYLHYGHNVKIQDHFFAAMIRDPPDAPIWTPMEYICGGVWVTPKFAMTSAYCLSYHKEINYAGHLGAHNEWLPTLKTFKIEEKFIYPNYSNAGDKWYENDIGLVRCASQNYNPLGYFPYFMRGSDWLNDQYMEEKPLLLHGFGRTESGEYAKKLKYMRGQLHLTKGLQYCNLPAVRQKKAICMEVVEEMDRIDNGDMGSVVYFNMLDVDPDKFPHKQRSVIGILSNSHYATSKLGVLTNISRYEFWIDNTIKMNS